MMELDDFDPEDDLGPARGIAFACVIMAPVWMVAAIYLLG